MDLTNKQTSPLWNQHGFDALLPSLYFIDIQQNCLVRLLSSARYVALSYVWGSCQPMRAYRSNIEQLERPGSLRTSRHQIPAVITDAMHLTAEIGERYLWVDSLCIIQDDLDKKEATINNMSLVYGNAILTIIAAMGNDASTGLAGIGTRPRSQKQEYAVIGPDLNLIVPHSLKALGQTTWSTRAWT
jgi:hypothetical protein